MLIPQQISIWLSFCVRTKVTLPTIGGKIVPVLKKSKAIEWVQGDIVTEVRQNLSLEDVKIAGIPLWTFILKSIGLVCHFWWTLLTLDWCHARQAVYKQRQQSTNLWPRRTLLWYLFKLLHLQERFSAIMDKPKHTAATDLVQSFKSQ